MVHSRVILYTVADAVTLQYCHNAMTDMFVGHAGGSGWGGCVHFFFAATMYYTSTMLLLLLFKQS